MVCSVHHYVTSSFTTSSTPSISLCRTSANDVLAKHIVHRLLIATFKFDGWVFKTLDKASMLVILVDRATSRKTTFLASLYVDKVPF